MLTGKQVVMVMLLALAAVGGPPLIARLSFELFFR